MWRQVKNGEKKKKDNVSYFSYHRNMVINWFTNLDKAKQQNSLPCLNTVKKKLIQYCFKMHEESLVKSFSYYNEVFSCPLTQT